MTCPLCCAPLDDAVRVGGAAQCVSCAHLWDVTDGWVRATNPKRDATLTAADVAALIPDEVA